jgi:hypothetical protein
MKFSLKDLLRSVTLASCGMACIAGFLRGGISVGLFLLCATAPLFGAVIGAFVQRAEKGFWIGVLAGFPILLIIGTMLVVKL